MTNITIYIVGIAVVIILLYALYTTRGLSEHFVTKAEKANAMVSWLKTDPTPTYAEFYSSIGKNIESDILEYRKLIEYKSQNTNLLKTDELARIL